MKCMENWHYQMNNLDYAIILTFCLYDLHEKRRSPTAGLMYIDINNGNYEIYETFSPILFGT